MSAEPLHSLESPLITQRRKAAGYAAEDAGAPEVGLALSGGGIRSATFALGVLQGLAKLGLLRRVDYLSTVSGGGYAGSFLGALFQRSPAGADATTAVSAELASKPGNEAFGIRWLRENGHYLSPARGSNLLLMAILLRNWLSVLANLFVAASALFLLEDVLRAAVPQIDEVSFALSEQSGFVLWWSPAWVLAGLALVATLPVGTAYWLVPSKVKGLPAWLRSWLSMLVAAAALAALVGLALATPEAVDLKVVGALGLLAGVFAASVAIWRATRVNDGTDEAKRATNDAKTRQRLTEDLKSILTLVLATAGWAAIDTFAQTLYALATSGVGLTRVAGPWFIALFAPAAAVAAFGQKVLNFVREQVGSKRQNKMITVPLDLIALVAGILLAATLLVSAGVFGHALAWGGKAPHGDPGLQIREALHVQVDQPSAATSEKSVSVPAASAPAPETARDTTRLSLAWTAACAGVAVLLCLLCSWTRPFLNHSSMAMFYSARLTRTFLGASNPKRRKAWQMLRQTGTTTAKMLDWTEVEEGDEIPLRAYAPHASGGPLHIINVTLNQTVGGDSTALEQDRKGLPMAFGPAAVSVGIQNHAKWLRMNAHELDLRGLPSAAGAPLFPVDETTLAEALPLGRLIGVSGAAVAPGLGGGTNLGVSLLTVLLNLRLGHWWHSGINVYAKPRASLDVGDRVFRAFARFFPVLMHFIDEATAQFRGTARRQWYLSDGGHFENTACYELIRRRLPLILCSDAGADADYGFADLANLVRKVRIDFGAEIRFLSRAEYEPLLYPTIKPYFGELEDLKRIDFRAERATQGRQPHAAIARIQYAAHDGEKEGPEGWLCVFKPTLCGEEPLDIREYAERNAEFPQQSTGDQSFDEAQWESYRRLGEHIVERVCAPARDANAEADFWTHMSKLCAPRVAEQAPASDPPAQGSDPPVDVDRPSMAVNPVGPAPHTGS